MSLILDFLLNKDVSDWDVSEQEAFDEFMKKDPCTWSNDEQTAVLFFNLEQHGRAVRQTTHGKEVAEKQRVATEAVERILYPNKDSLIKRMKPSFSLPSVLCTPGQHKKFTVKGFPCVKAMRTSFLRCNAPAPGIFFIKFIQVENLVTTVGMKWIDPKEHAPREGDPPEIVSHAVHISEEEIGWLDAFGDHPIELPTLDKNMSVTISGSYSGVCPIGHPADKPYLFTMTFFGDATLM